MWSVVSVSGGCLVQIVLDECLFLLSVVHFLQVSVPETMVVMVVGVEHRGKRREVFL